MVVKFFYLTKTGLLVAYEIFYNLQFLDLINFLSKILSMMKYVKLNRYENSDMPKNG